MSTLVTDDDVKPKAIIRKDDARCIYAVTNGRCRNVVAKGSIMQLCVKHQGICFEYGTVCDKTVCESPRVYVDID